MHSFASQCGEVPLPIAVSMVFILFLISQSVGGARDPIPPPAHPPFIRGDLTPSSRDTPTFLIYALFCGYRACRLHFFALELQIFIPQHARAGGHVTWPATQQINYFEPLDDPFMSSNHSHSIQLAKIA